MSTIDDAKNRMCGDIDSPINEVYKLKIGDEFLKILRDNAFNGTDGGDVIDNIARIAKITEWIKMSIMTGFGFINSGVTCEEEAKRRNSGAKTKTFEEYCYLLLYAVSNKEDTAYQRQLITRNA
ncbi:hypothetical protein Tco_0364420 [Tanacetum coccineum]